MLPGRFAVEEKRSCSTCVFSAGIKSLVVGQWAGVCHLTCPVPVLIPVVLDGGLRELSVRSMQPPVTGNDWCFQYSKKEAQ